MKEIKIITKQEVKEIVEDKLEKKVDDIWKDMNKIRQELIKLKEEIKIR